LVTKLKNIWTNPKFKIACSILAVVFIALSFDSFFIGYGLGTDGSAKTENYMVFFILGFICVILACVSAGHENGTDGIRLLPMDGFWIDSHFFILVIVEILILAMIVFSYSVDFPKIDMLLLFGVGVALGLNFLLSLTRIIKDHSFLEHYLFWKILAKFLGFSKRTVKNLTGYYNDVMKGSSAVKRFMAFSIGLVILGWAISIPVIGILSLTIIVGILYAMEKKVRQYFAGRTGRAF